MAVYTVYFPRTASKGNPWSVQVTWDESGITELSCDCPAGSWTQLCKHLKAFFSGETKFLEPTQEETFLAICARVRLSPITKLYEKLNADIRFYDDSNVTASMKAVFVDRLRRNKSRMFEK